MSNLFVRIVEGIGAFLVGSCKIILFLAILAFLIVQFFWIWTLSAAPVALNLAVPNLIGTVNYLFAIASAITALLGSYAVLKSHQSHLRSFACLCGLVALLLVAFKTFKSFDDANEKFAENLRSSFKDYNWIQNQPDSKVNDPTRYVDQIQRGLYCCGVDGPNDWNQYRPAGVANDKYPTSCCFQTGSPGQPIPLELCSNKAAMYDRGCLEDIKLEEGFYGDVHGFFIFCLILLGILAFIMSMAVSRRETDFPGVTIR